MSRPHEHAAPSAADESASFCATLVEEWVNAGVRHAVVAPGSRSTPMAVAIARCRDLRLHLFHDERSASFAALGIGLATGQPAILLCTSGTAAAHFHAAVIEAHQSDVPMLVCTADRPPELRDVGAPQTIDQTNLYAAAVRWFHDPGVASFEAAGSWRSLAARSHALATGPRPGPVHLNLPFREPLLGDATMVPPARPGAWSSVATSTGVDDRVVDRVAREISGRRGVIVAGMGATPEVLELADALGWPILADARSGLRRNDDRVVIGFDPLLRCAGFTAGREPEVVLRVGQPPASKVLAQWVTAVGASVVQLTRSPAMIDPDHQVAVTVRGDVGALCAALASSVDRHEDVHWRGGWSTAAGIVHHAIEAWTASRMSEPTVARTVTKSMAPGSHLVVSSSMPIRDVEWFGAAMPGVTVHSNRGANGIDGVVSTAVGVALGTGAPTTLLIGDVACVHDSNGLWALAARGVDLKVVVVNNDGGSIFSFLPQASSLDGPMFELLFGTPHGVSFAHLARAHGIDHVEVRDRDELVGALGAAGPRMIEARFARSANVGDHESLNEAVMSAIDEEFRA